MIRKSALPELLAVLIRSSCSCVRLVICNSCSMPRMPFRGVRNSWLTLARNSFLAILAASAYPLTCIRACKAQRRRSRNHMPLMNISSCRKSDFSYSRILFATPATQTTRPCSMTGARI